MNELMNGFNMDEFYMHRCLELARLGLGFAAPNPIVGVVMVYKDHIIGEGFHEKYGQAHAEVNCINSVKADDRPFISQSKMYVSLEPCVHFGKTPPCADLIIKNKIPEVIIGCRDSYKKVNGKGIEGLRSAGVNVKLGVLEKQCREINSRFFTFHEKQRPYIILKWAQSADKKIALRNLAKGTTFENPDKRRLFISNEFTNRLVHRWRSEEAGILVGTHTALLDDPQLTTRLWPGNSPIRLVVDMELKLPESLRLFDRSVPTIVFNLIKHDMHSLSLSILEKGGLGFYQVLKEESLVNQMANALFTLNIQSMIVEGGASLLQSFIDEEIWDEARIITNSELMIDNGPNSPSLVNAKKIEEQTYLSDLVEIFRPAGK
ncbi:MAG TPA: bifunctional diaminohydroxyphosphoribosylaminopyrimidine deaminase/5-amino-6-(5-phosphoribosylamino)uracil reductase RibD [Chitinophagaceae bacterium]|nr:bifunctional diaminohydroxyphosphoribosylaminopyrimidine deaminase/5-amino-6-(5-phosphoribosylamino)uracil reductase RibD [Chitinophagaceae bacterium]